MPAPTDHPTRRRELVSLAFRLIAREGLEAASVRRLSAAAGFSTTIVTHYFPNKGSLLLAVYQYCAHRAQASVDKVLANNPSDLRGCLEALLPIGEDSRAGWRVNFAFWQLALRNKAFADEQQWWTNHAEETIAAVLRASGRSADAVRAEARYLLTLVQGIAVRAALEPEWSDDGQRAFLHELLLRR